MVFPLGALRPATRVLLVYILWRMILAGAKMTFAGAKMAGAKMAGAKMIFAGAKMAGAKICGAKTSHRRSTRC